MAECVPPGIPEPWYLRRIFRLLHHGFVGKRLFNFQSLVRFKAKFRPRWEPVYIAGWPKIGIWSLYLSCRMWGLFGAPAIDPPHRLSIDSASGSGQPRVE